MSLKCMPLLFLNMGGEMIYILQQRLKAQNVSKEKTVQVLQDILYILFNSKFLEELFKPQYICSMRIMRIFFEKLVHSSIMRLNETSMEKLYALMTMAYKYQLQLCNQPEHIVFITLNHLDSIRTILPDDEKLNKLLDIAHRMVVVTYHEIPSWEQAMIRSCLLNFFQDSRVNVSLFLREKKQTDDGRFILFPELNCQLPYGGNPPGKIQYYVDGKEAYTETFLTDDGDITYEPCTSRGNIQLRADDRGIKLGTNMYTTTETLLVKSSDTVMKSEDPAADDELQLLSALIISPEQNQQKGFDLNLFADDIEEETIQQGQNISMPVVTHIDARKHRKTITAAVADLKVEVSSRQSKKGEDVLNLLDEAAKRPNTAAAKSSSRRKESRTRAKEAK